MNRIEMEIDGKLHGFNDVWVHLQDVTQQDSVYYRIIVAATYVQTVFDPYSTIGHQTTWPNFIMGMIRELGTFIVQGFIDNMGEIVGKREKVYLWVIATVDEAVETENNILLIGRAVQFVPRG